MNAIIESIAKSNWIEAHDSFYTCKYAKYLHLEWSWKVYDEVSYGTGGIAMSKSKER